MQSTNWQRRAEAAEKTSELLKQKVIELYDSGSKTTIHKQLEMAAKRQERTARRQAVMSARAAELEKHSATLEVTVKERTQQIRTILDNVTFGFCLIDRDSVVQEGHTQSCFELLRTEEIAGRKIGEILQLDEKAMSSFLLGLDEIFEDIMPEDVTLAQVRGRFSFDDDTVQIQYRVIRDDTSDDILALLLSISDITSLEHAERQNALNSALLNIMKHRPAFLNFLGESHERLADCKASIDDQPAFRRQIHTLKGNAGSFGLDEVVSVIHEEENRDRLGTDTLERVETAFAKFLDSHYGALQIRWSDSTAVSYDILDEHLNSLVAIAEGASDESAGDVSRWVAERRSRPVGDALGPIPGFVSRLASRLNKKVEFKLDGGDVRVHMETVGPILQNISHLLRNAIDHGLEETDARGSKDETGNVGIRIRDGDTTWSIEVWDDGSGIDTDAVVRKACEQGRHTAEEMASWDEARRTELIFDDGLSCAARATDISGRGVGMGAVKAAVQSSGGHMKIDSTPGKGSCFTLAIPKPDALKPQLAVAS